MRSIDCSVFKKLGILLGFIIGGLTDELHHFPKNSETRQGSTTDSTASLSGILQVSMYVFQSLIVDCFEGTAQIGITPGMHLLKFFHHFTNESIFAVMFQGSAK